MTTAEEFKAKGNAALQAGNTTEAIQFYTKAIDVDGANHVYFSNRSAAYLKKGDANNALADAESCLALNPNFAKAYSRKGAALHGCKRYNDSIVAYEEGLAKFPNDKGLQSGLAEVKKSKDRPMGGGMGGGMPGMGGGGGPFGGMNPFAGGDLIARMAMDPKLRTYLNDADFMQKIQQLQKDPNALMGMIGDPRIMEVLSSVIGGGRGGPDDDGGPPPPAPPAADTKAAESKVESKEKTPDVEMKDAEEDEEDDMGDMTPEELKKHQDKKESVKVKAQGNALYKKKDFEGALAAYDKAIALDPTNMTFLSNKAAVYFTTKKWDECIEACEEAVEVGKANLAPFADRGKALTRCGKAWHKKGDFTKAVETLKNAQLECFDKETQRLLKTWELEKKKKDMADYQDDAKAEEAKQKGNDHFRAKEWAKAVECYEEAVKRAPKNAPIRNNLSAALCKIMDFNGAKRQIEEALALDPQYVKAYARKGDIEVVMKENHKAMESYRKGLEIDPSNASCREGLQKVTAMVNSSGAMSEEERKERAEHAMADPEIQSILQDPVIRQVLQDFNENPNAAQAAMRDFSVRSKIEKLIAGGILQMG
eukprot:CAMPEP_0172483384 /NCGR_PEP_ID=MMETSP1066-20121228/10360_1 /TAXON_ID=671091 /ORGANISM="Coscinodiscus wailesii, Strain CCMP2513" /LENGTH=593 /DNA_ID=CAMNT_0013247223 /DNA_START=156 /DNA_END=1937 /DNA_ORIENTATION=-